MNVYRYYYDRLKTGEAKLLYCEIYDGIMKLENVIVCERIPSWQECMNDVVDALWMDNTFLTAVWDSHYVKFNEYDDELVVTVRYFYPKQICRQTLTALQDAANRCLRESGALETEADVFTKLGRMHDYLSKKCEYDNEAIGNSEAYIESFNATGCLLSNRCVCEGSADAFKLLCDAIDIPCIFIAGSLTGTGKPLPEGHAWCYVFAGTKWWHLDISQGIANTYGDNVCRRWFMLGEETNRIDHTDYEAPFPHNT